ncbi:MAG: PIN domain-containing protein [Calditrichaeota bacterium]|nr:MAG: PIN domain-containing protein [Calditrichota bacterium]MBL1207884.1 PIN domain-containing protein [Calditrichota bacterium]NOG47719.1 PIN domain-containing protein [Calditrichota bacterium]
MKLFLDTHVIIWLYQRNKKPFSKNALKLLDLAELYFPSISFLEISFLNQLGKINFTAIEAQSDLTSNVNIVFARTDTFDLSKEASTMVWTRDPFDRLITAEASFHQAKLLTKDKLILKNYDNATW